jgi:hypothetical protein
MKTFETTATLKLPESFGIEEVQVKVTYHIENDGIGAYEYWGAKCFDRGQDYIEIDDIVYTPANTEEQFEYFMPVMKYINNNFEECANSIVNTINHEYEYPEPPDEY